MRQSIVRGFAPLFLLAAGTAGAAIVQHEGHVAPVHEALAKAVAAPTRTPANLARDQYRHPAETLAFFGVKPSDTVVEIWPGGGWYTEILAPYVASGGGTLYTVASGRGLNGVNQMKQANPALYGAVKTADFPAMTAEAPRVPDDTADAVLTFRNVHNWQMGERPFAAEAFRQMFAMLKSGGTLGIVEHRLPESADSALERTSGYTKLSTVRRLAEEAGFRFVGTSEVNANPKDKADHPGGVWSLPPTLQGGETDRDKYLAIGESDRMTVKFVKP
ncbi:class I SAM-dependent methyltransferase [Allosphingosinicella flava]|uniref:Class I SAM-dependent methyltransferase n=1 Tax=Allosphingosinicella flava TaxID=2771430 RepID=A0A7T2GJZ5_9SPHN|nr:class I SAM-dependent methyltransferase [Sphingosinicella flava]QPQ55236.1 class I SAM-dependent methyltransferase [Sphingosinicella flava]